MAEPEVRSETCSSFEAWSWTVDGTVGWSWFCDCQVHVQVDALSLAECFEQHRQRVVEVSDLKEEDR
jgi:hypothetical protein